MKLSEKILTLGKIFHVSMDVLLKDELMLSEVEEVHSCGTNAVQEKKQEVYEGILIKESIADDRIIDLLNVHKIELWNAGGRPKYWTALFLQAIKKIFRSRFPGPCYPVLMVRTGLLILRQLMRNTLCFKIGF